MMYSFRIEQAIRAASILHQGQVRKGLAPYPSVSHLFAVSTIVADYTNDENLIIAALLHDVLEDTDYTADELEKDFGERVRTIVVGVSELTDIHDRRSWMERRNSYLHTLARAGEDSRIISAAETIHNMRSIIEEYQNAPGDYFEDFGGTFEEKLLYYQKLSNLLNRELKCDIVHEFNHVFNEYKTFAETGRPA